ncbi:daunorubicin/doxorubicin resistance ABC transporter ATP-binding protein DrrA [Streptosporangium nondiastaticum]|uniref:Daunorubicin/doxorubicin resistance ABC transporter ATP-binding protein DrrA n=1 Tax=Streptosporangium nondiastaticum TaxID=35764 RepID=A0A9X7JKU3_9ACTN|nr:ATP-binding cassette domain-containing protein [Streptosporangium nondiastaticum]PSJ25487.1 daunorubicin/doxorubicin resistance ABC transporter ATP-binding protein DrrA [Streptosporangium nondiastaticum]
MSGLAAPIAARAAGDVMIEAYGVSKVFGSLRALDSVSLSARRGTVLGLLGHNGAGKTTLVNVLAAALPPSSGRAAVAGFDVTRDPREVRKRIGLTGQFASVDPQLSGRDNLVLLARLLGADRRSARARADELLELFGLQAFAARRPGTYSGGLRRRLDLAASLVGHPAVIFLDEPTTGLDPSSRIGLWEIVEDLVAGGTTVLLTTQYLDEADRLADSITVLSAGAVIASGTAAELKAQVGKRTVTVTPAPAAGPAVACAALRHAGLEPVPDRENGTVVVAIEASKDVAEVIRALDRAGVEATELSFREPSLDDVYLALAGRSAGAAS